MSKFETKIIRNSLLTQLEYDKPKMEFSEVVAGKRKSRCIVVGKDEENKRQKSSLSKVRRNKRME